MTPSGPPTSRRRLKPEDRREEILDAAVAVLNEASIEGLTMEAIAARAAANKALPYYHFKTREGVLVALVDREFDRLSTAIVSAAEGQGSFRDRLRGVIDVWLSYADTQSVLAVLEVVQSRTGELDEARARHLIQAAQFFSDLLREGYELSRSEALILTGALMGSSRGLFPAWKATGWSRKRTIDAYVSICIGAIERVIADRPPTGRARSAKRRSEISG